MARQLFFIAMLFVEDIVPIRLASVFQVVMSAAKRQMVTPICLRRSTSALYSATLHQSLVAPPQSFARCFGQIVRSALSFLFGIAPQSTRASTLSPDTAPPAYRRCHFR